MVLTEIQFTESQVAALQRLSSERNESVDELVRISVERFLGNELSTGRNEIRERAKRVAGKFASGSSDISSRHDEYLYGALAE